MFEFIEPNRTLKKYIQHYCIVELNDSNNFLPFERVYPNGNICMVFHYGDPSKFQKRSSGAYIESNFVICGQQTNYYDLSLAGKTGMILITFKPHGFKSFFNFPAKEISNENVSLKLLMGNEAKILECKLLEARDPKKRIAHLEDFLLHRLLPGNDFDRIDYAIRLIADSKGQMKTQDISRKICLGIKQFERVFSDYVGINPKKFGSIIRFQHVLQTKKQCKKLSMCQLAFDNGYYDQSHFIHDFKSITGRTPSEFFNISQ